MASSTYSKAYRDHKIELARSICSLYSQSVMSRKNKGRNSPELTAAGLKQAAGITHRQLHDWDVRAGALPRSRRVGTAGWRRFTGREAFVIMTCMEIRKRFGVPLQKLGWLQRFMLQEGADHCRAALQMMSLGFAVFILTDLESHFQLETDYELGNLLRIGMVRDEGAQGYILLGVTHIVHQLLEVLGAPDGLRISKAAYQQLRQADAALQSRTS